MLELYSKVAQIGLEPQQWVETADDTTVLPSEVDGRMCLPAILVAGNLFTFFGL